MADLVAFSFARLEIVKRLKVLVSKEEASGLQKLRLLDVDEERLEFYLTTGSHVLKLE